MSESGDYSPGPWRGHDFTSARNAYVDNNVGRGYSKAVSKGVQAKDCAPKTLSTKSQNPIVIDIDVTGSMGSWPATICSKLPYLDHEAGEYFGDDYKISFSATGDAYSDRYPMQAQKFVAGTSLKKNLDKIIFEGNGGGQGMKTYGLNALYYARNVSMPNAVNPVYIFIGDEDLYPDITKDHAKEFAYTTLDNKMKTVDAIAELTEKFSTYLIKVPYHGMDGDKLSLSDKRICKKWANVIGEDHIAILADPNRVVDVIFGIFANEMGMQDYFHEEITERQTKDQVKTVMKSLKSMHQLPKNASRKKLPDLRSITKKSGGKQTSDLL